MSLLLSLCGVNESPDCVFDRWARTRDYLTVDQVHRLYASIRYEGVSPAQVQSAVRCTCCSAECCTRDEFTRLLDELDRRYALVEDVRWEFNLMAQQYGGSLSETDALFLFRAVQNGRHVMQRWREFVGSRTFPDTGITWDEIEVPLCTPVEALSSKEQDEERRLMAEETAEKKLLEEEERQHCLHDEEQARQRRQQQLDMLEKMKCDLEDQHRSVREKMNQEVAMETERQLLAEKKLAEDQQFKHQHLLRQQELAKAMAMEQEQRRKKEEEKMAGQRLKEAAQREKEAAIALVEAERLAREASSKAEKEAAAEAERRALAAMRKEKEQRIRQSLDSAIKSRDALQLEPAIAEVKREQVPNCSEQLTRAERLLGQLRARGNLQGALVTRHLQRLEVAMKDVCDGGFERELEEEMKMADQLLVKLRRLEEMKIEVLNLNQQKVAEIKSYKKPPSAVHQVMIATFLLLGNPEDQTHSWPATQILIGKTGKDALKRRVKNCDVTAVPLKVARRVKVLLDRLDVDGVREASQGCAIFYAWAMGTVEERLDGEKS